MIALRALARIAFGLRQSSMFMLGMLFIMPQCDAQDCPTILELHSFLSTAQLSCKFESYSEKLMAQAKNCAQQLPDSKVEQSIRGGMEKFQAKAKAMGQSRACKAMMNDYYPFYSSSADTGEDAESGYSEPKEQPFSRCTLEVNGISYIQGPCKGYLEDDGGFQITKKDYFAVVNLQEPNKAEGFWNEEAGATHAHSPLGILQREGACWKNKNASICVWK